MDMFYKERAFGNPYLFSIKPIAKVMKYIFFHYAFMMYANAKYGDRLALVPLEPVELIV